MKKRIILLVGAILLAVSLAFTACAGAAPAPTTAAPSPAAPRLEDPAMPVTGGGAIAFQRNVYAAADVGWAEAMLVEEADFAMDFEIVPVTGGPGMEMPAEHPAGDMLVAGGNAMGQVPTTRRMIVTTYSLTAETMEFEVSRNFIRDIIHDFGGYISGSWEGGRGYRDVHREREASFTLRIPTGRVHEFVALMGENTNVVDTSVHTEDITASFFDNTARLASLVNQESLLVGLLDAEDAGLEYILQVHRELAFVRHQIEYLNTTIQRQEHSVSYSTVNIRLREVIQYRPVYDLPTTFGERISQAVSSSWDNFVWHSQNTFIRAIGRFPFFIVNLLQFVFWVAVFLIVRMFIRKKKGRLPGESTFEWLPIGRIRKGKAPAKPETDRDDN
ncbi:MAG: DUF4349 domain-containing protein [Oscillospiraceae bacterium]|nr:DUF4349 domain-containing protein [Oscillospiraceae bacterium]